MGVLQRLLAKEVKYDDTLGYLTKDDIRKLKDAEKKHSTKTYKTWDCVRCKQSRFYPTIKCQLCEGELKETTHPVSRMLEEVEA
jgi:hypothetical protein